MEKMPENPQINNETTTSLEVERTRLRDNLEELEINNKKIEDAPTPLWFKVSDFLERGDNASILFALSVIAGNEIRTGDLSQSIINGIVAGIIAKLIGFSGNKK